MPRTPSDGRAVRNPAESIVALLVGVGIGAALHAFSRARRAATKTTETAARTAARTAVTAATDARPHPPSADFSAGGDGPFRKISDGGPDAYSAKIRNGPPPSQKDPFGRRDVRPVEILVHNVSHTDMVLNLFRPPDAAADAAPPYPKSDDGGIILCRPRFSAFRRFSSAVRNALRSELRSGGRPSAVCFPLLERDASSDRTPALVEDGAMLPIGFDLRGHDDPLLRVDEKSLAALTLRRRDAAAAFSGPGLRIGSVLLPLLAVIMPRWEEELRDRHGSGAGLRRVKKVIILVSGVGRPRNPTHEPDGNSTELCAEIMEAWIVANYPSVAVVRVHEDAGSNIFRHDDNIRFVKMRLVPIIEAYRDALGRRERYPDEEERPNAAPLPFETHGSGRKKTNFDPEWRRNFGIMLSFADGSPARTHAIRASLRRYRPRCMHFWQLKTFWHEGKVCLQDTEVYSFEDMDTDPPLEVPMTSRSVQMVVEEMKRFKEEFLRQDNCGRRSDLRRFWLRKTRKPVLAVLLVEPPGCGAPTLYRGCNMEVSMPTGSLCAERNVIGTALAANPGLMREDLRMVAVLAINLQESPSAQPLLCRAVAPPWEIEPDPMPQLRSEVPRGMSVGSATSEISHTVGVGGGGALDGKDAEMLESYIAQMLELSGEGPRRDDGGEGGGDVADAGGGPSPSPPPPTPVRRIRLYSGYNIEDESDAPGEKMEEDGTGARRRRGAEGSPAPLDGSGRKEKRTVLIHSEEDLNPLKPCGACNEWLKKIAEPNPGFQVITFTDADCNGVYVSACQD